MATTDRVRDFIMDDLRWRGERGDAPASPIELRTVEGSIHALRRISAQDAMVALTTDWLTDIHDGAARAA